VIVRLFCFTVPLHRKRIAALAVIGGIGILPAIVSRQLTAADNNEAASREANGNLTGALNLLEQQAKSGGVEGQLQLAEFQDRHRLPDLRNQLGKLAEAEQDPARRQLALRQILLLDFEEGRTASLAGDLNQYKSAGGSDLQAPKPLKVPGKYYANTSIPGPLRSFARMAALSPDLAPDDLLPALARNVVTNGYQAISSNEALDQTEYLRLLIRYIGQARELTSIAGGARKIVVPSCDSEQTADLLRILGYRMRGSCGGDLVLETVNPTRAFLTVDSAFPIAQLEQDLRANRKFEYPYAPTEVPVLYGPEYWMGAAIAKNNHPEFIDMFLGDPSICRLYLGLSKLDNTTAEELRRKVPQTELRLYAPVLDFFGGMFEIRNGVAFVPGSEKIWADLAGAKPSEGAGFYQKLIETDDGWLASYFDALARLDSPTAAYLLRADRMKRFYEAIRGKVTTPGPARPVFRSSTDLLLLTTSLRLDANGELHIPGGVDVWKTLFVKHPHGKYDSRLSKSANSWKAPDDLIEALFALCRKSVENEPLHIFLALNDVDRERQTPISPEMASRLIANYRTAGAQYSIFADVPNVSENSMTMFLNFVSSSNDIRDTLVRSDAVGSAQALVGIWQILCRENAIAPQAQDAAFASLLNPFLKARQSTEVFDAARAGVKTLLDAANAPSSPHSPDQLDLRLSDILVGMPHAAPERTGPAENFLRVLDAQHLLSLDKLFAVADTLGQPTPNKKVLDSVDSELTRFEEAQALRNSLSSAERNLLALGYWSERHIDQERKLDLAALAKSNDRKDARGHLTPFLRDTLVGFLYAYYAPDGAQLVFANAMFVRSHDFIGAQGLAITWRNTEIVGNGWPASAGGRLMGSLVSLPYVLAEAEQNFLSPTREQALIWGDLVPQIIVDVTVPRWRNVSNDQIRWAALNLRRGEDLVALAAFNPEVESRVMTSLRRFASPARLEKISEHLHKSDYAGARNEVLPSEFYALATDPQLKSAEPDLADLEIAQMSSAGDPKLSPSAIAASFGTPKPTLTHSYRPGLLYLRTFPTLMGYSSRLLAETWESNGFFYAALADEVGIPANQLDFYVPEWTRATIENIFATHLEDWPALLRSLRTVGDNVRQHAPSEKAALNALNQSSN
jgi:hypothetical protein